MLDYRMTKCNYVLSPMWYTLFVFARNFRCFRLGEGCSFDFLLEVEGVTGKCFRNFDVISSIGMLFYSDVFAFYIRLFYQPRCIYLRCFLFVKKSHIYNNHYKKTRVPLYLVQQFHISFILILLVTDYD